MISFHDIAKGSDHMVKFLHVATGNRVEFPAFITEFSDSYQVSWGNEQIFGRMDPIKPYQGTTRNINLAFDVLSPSLEKAKENMFNYSRLIQMLYPVYSNPIGGTSDRSRIIKAPPLIRLQFLNLIKNNSIENKEQGLLGCINGFSFNPNRESGFFTQDNELLPKNFNVSFNFIPQHEGTLGFEENKFISRNFPYGRTEPETPTSDTIGSRNSAVNQSRINKTLGNK